MKGPCIGGVCVDVAAQFAGQVGDGSEDAPCDHIALDSGKPKFDLVQPRRVSGCEVEVNAGILFQKFTHQGGFVSREIVQDDVDLLLPGAPGDHLLEEPRKLAAGVASGSFAMNYLDVNSFTNVYYATVH